MPITNRRPPHWKRTLATTLLAALLHACSNGSGTGIGGTGFSDEPITTTGVITGFGSIIVNGIEFDTAQAQISVDDAPANESDLKLGMVVTVSGTVSADTRDRAVAHQVVFDDDVQGPVESVTDSPDGRQRILTVLNRRVRIDRTETVYDGVDYATIAIGDLIEVSGFADADGSLRATRIEKKAVFVPGASEIEIKGTVAAVTGTTFRLGRYTVDFSGADLTEVGGRIIDGLTVEVEGTLSGDRITALRIEQEEDDDFDDAGGKVKIEGIVTAFTGIGNFQVGDFTVDAANARLEPADLTIRNGMRLEVEGYMVGGILRATEISAYRANVVIEARVVAVDAASGTLSMGFVPGVLRVQTTASTRWDGGNGPGIDALRAGDFLEIHALVDAADNVVAARVEPVDADSDRLQGPVSRCIPGEAITVLGLDFVLSDGITEYEIGDDEVSSSAVFCREMSRTTAFVIVEDDEDRRDGIADEIELAD